MLERLLGAYPIVRIQLQERTRDQFALHNVVQPWKTVTQLAGTIKT